MGPFFAQGEVTMIRHLSIDIETFSSVDIKKSGMYKYAQSPDFEIMLLAYSWDGQPPHILDLTIESVRSSMEWSSIQHALQNPKVIKHAYNAPFEWYCLNRAGFTTPLEQWQDTMLHGLYCGYTAGLAATGAALGLPQDKRKMGIGTRLINMFCKPCKPSRANGNRTRTLPRHEPDQWQLFKDYCVQDVVTEMEIERRLSSFPVPEAEQQLWRLDQQINAYGVAVDMSVVEGALHCGQVVADQFTQEAIKITGLDNPKSVQQLSKWLNEQLEDEEITDLRKETVKGLVKTVDDDAARRVLEIRLELAKTSTKKYDAMQAAVGEGSRARGLLQFYGANRTGRWAGRLIQVQNLPRNYLSALDYARELVKAQKVDYLKLVYGSVPDTLSQLIRTAFVPSSGSVFLVADFSAIEARVIAWLAGEEWRQQVFATHGKIYEASASAMFGVPIEQIGKGSDLRQRGKIAELALGYQGHVGALKAMGADKMGLSDEELSEIVMRWRNANRRIVDLWYSVDRAALEMMRTGQPQGVRGIIFSREGDYANGQDFMTITLPSGRKLYYPKPFLQVNDKGREALHYHGVNQQTRKWEITPTYGGKLVENIVQAIARDCLAETLMRAQQGGFQTVMHVHDELICDHPGDNAKAELERLCDLMGQPISWAPGLLLRAEGFITSYYKKD